MLGFFDYICSMEAMLDWLRAALAAHGETITLLDAVGTTLGLIYLWLEYKANIWMWVVGIVMPVIDIYLYFKTGLYADFGMAIYYSIAAIVAACSIIVPSPIPRISLMVFLVRPSSTVISMNTSMIRLILPCSPAFMPV